MNKIIYFKKRGNEMTNIMEVARYFLSLESMTHLKLQKICYYAQAWHLALYNNPLVDSKFEAWVHGPVSPKLYRHYKQWGWYEIAKYEGDVKNLNNETQNFLNQIFKLYGKFSGEQLEALTHEETPWKKARGNCKNNEICRNVISEDEMRIFYVNLLKESMNG